MMHLISHLQNWARLFLIFILLSLLFTSCVTSPAPSLPPTPSPTPPSAPEPELEPSILISAPKLISPNNNATEVDVTPILLWEEVPDAEGYEVCISRNYDFSDVVIDASCVLSSYHVYEELSPETRYYWMVCAKSNPADPNAPIAYSEVWTFTTPSKQSAISPTPPPAPVPTPEQHLPRQPYPNQTEQMERYITPTDPAVKEFLQDILQREAVAFNDFERLRDWVSSYISYTSDQDVHGVDEYWQLPAETIELRTGDCEDFAILLCSLLRAYGVPSDQVYVALGFGEDQTHGHAYLIEKWYQGIWRITEPQAGAWAGVFLMDWVTEVSYETLYCFNDQRCLEGLPTLLPGVYEFQLSFIEGASAMFERYMSSGQTIMASVEWLGKCGNEPEPFTVFGWGLRIYDPYEHTVLGWFGGDLSRSFSYTTSTSGKYKVQVYIGGALPTSGRLTIAPPDWE
jgi:predicted transglutaminase-like cysteine proteinase